MDGSAGGAAPTGAAVALPALSESTVRNLITNWYHSMNDHVPVDEMAKMLADDVQMTYPEVGHPFIGIPAFRDWYAGVVTKYFDQTHLVEKWDIHIDSDRADVAVVVRWEHRSWESGEATSTYAANLSHQRFRIERSPEDGRVLIREKHAITFGPTSAVYGPWWTAGLGVADAIALARAGDVGGLQRWLAAGGNPDQYDLQGWTPLLAAATRGQAPAAQWLVTNPYRKADLSMPHAVCGALPIHFAGQSGDMATAAALLSADPHQLNKVWDLNGHTLFLQAVFFNHPELSAYALEQGADTTITTACGLGGMELAAQFQNRAIMDIIRPFDSPVGEKKSYFDAYLRRIAPVVPARDEATQDRSDKLVRMIEAGLQQAATDGDVARPRDEVCQFIDAHGVDVNRLGGPLGQPPLVVVATGSDGEPASPARAALRSELARALLERRADPRVCERHPMGVDTISHAAVFNHRGTLEAISTAMTAEQLADALNHRASVNGMTALHVTVLGATTASPDRLEGYLDQVKWLVANGADVEVEDYCGITQRALAEKVADPPCRQRLLMALGVVAG
jgi:hypothetical protein